MNYLLNPAAAATEALCSPGLSLAIGGGAGAASTPLSRSLTSPSSSLEYAKSPLRLLSPPPSFLNSISLSSFCCRCRSLGFRFRERYLWPQLAYTMRKRIEKMQKGTMVQRRTMLQVCEQCVFFPLLLMEPLGDRRNASVAPMIFLESGSD